jgi:hypothetical protein
MVLPSPHLTASRARSRAVPARSVLSSAASFFVDAIEHHNQLNITHTRIRATFIIDVYARVPMIARNKLVENGKGKHGRELSLKAMPLSFPWTLPNGNRPNGYYPDVEVDVDSSSYSLASICCNPPGGSVVSQGIVART